MASPQVQERYRTDATRGSAGAGSNYYSVSLLPIEDRVATAKLVLRLAERYRDRGDAITAAVVLKLVEGIVPGKGCLCPLWTRIVSPVRLRKGGRRRTGGHRDVRPKPDSEGSKERT
jgi:hypothetical protein